MSTRGAYRGSPSRDFDRTTRLPRRLAVAENISTTQTTITTVVDLSGLSISFAVTIYPVKVRLYLPFMYGSLAGSQALVSITDAANAAKSTAAPTSPVANGAPSPVVLEEEILVAGSYSRKGRIALNSGGGNISNYADAAGFRCFIEAVEFKAAA